MVLLPALMIFGLALWRVEVQRSLLVSIVVGVAIAIGQQGYGLDDVLRFVLLGFQLQMPSPLGQILQGGGLVAMVRVCLVVALSTALAGVIAQTKALSLVERWLSQANTRSRLLLRTTVISIAAAAFGCTQTIAILLTQQLVQDAYRVEPFSSEQLAVDLENTAVVLSPLVPWNIAGLVPATILMTDAGYIPYAVYLYALPLLSWGLWRYRDGQQGRKQDTQKVPLSE
jgi:NhaC family Na+:H+ antiporter